MTTKIDGIVVEVIDGIVVEVIDDNTVRFLHRVPQRFHRQKPLTYARAHYHLARARGSATEQTCVDCGKPGRRWSLKRNANFTSTQIGGQNHGREFSSDPTDYEPRCGSCSMKYSQNYNPQCLTAGCDQPRAGVALNCGQHRPKPTTTRLGREEGRR